MKKLGRCGRHRRSISNKAENSGSNQTHLSKYVKLCQWIKESVGVSRWKSDSWHSLEQACFKDTGRGLRATKNISVGDTLVCIPRELLITTSTVLDSQLGALIQRNNCKFSPQQLLTMFLVIERHRGSASKWSPYICSLPADYSLPLYFTDLEFMLLTPHARKLTVSSVQRFQNACWKMTAFIQKCAPELKPAFVEENVRWAWSTVNSRSVYLQTEPNPSLILEPEECHMALAPFLDFLNHRDLAKTTAGLNTDTNCYEIVTLDAYKRHQQVFICYGNHDNVNLMIHYGFTLPSNVNNSVNFTLDSILTLAANEAQHMDRKCGLIKDAQLDRNLKCTSDGLSWSLLMAIKIATLTWQQLPRWKCLLQGAVLSQSHEKLSHQLALRLVDTALVAARKHLTFVNMQPKSAHYELLKSLALDDVAVLEQSMYLLVETKQLFDSDGGT